MHGFRPTRPGRGTAGQASQRRWLRSQPAVFVRSTLPTLKGGDTISIHVWYDAG